MARIPDEELERLKAEVSVEHLVAAAGVDLKAAGKDLLGRCPFHEDREASLVVTPGKNLWHCFSCQIGGGPSAALTAPRARGSRLLPAAVEFDAGDQALMDQAIRYYQERLKQTPEALAYLARRGLDDAELIERHRLGFADRTLGCGCRRRPARRDTRSGAACKNSVSYANPVMSILTAQS
jgi:DNA primase